MQQHVLQFFRRNFNYNAKEGRNWELGLSPSLCALCASEGGPSLTQVFSQDLVMPALLSSHFLLISKSSLPAECCPWLLLSPVAGLEKASEVPPPPLNRSNKPNTALLRKLPHRPNLLLLDWSKLVNPAADFLSSLSLLSSQMNVVKRHKFHRHM